MTTGDQIWYQPFGQLLEAVFLRRENRFRAEVALNGIPVKVHVPNSGRMQELLIPGAKVWIQPASTTASASGKQRQERKTAYTLLLVQQGERYVCLNAHLANELVEFWLKHDLLPEFVGCSQIERERTIGKSRMDFRLHRGQQICYAEVKSVNLLVEDVARFPDAPTVRGSKHLEELMQCKAQGLDAAVIFVVMGNEAKYFSPNGDTDPVFAANLALALEQGVEVYIYTCEINLEGIRYTGRIPMQEETEWKYML